jgi:hypothetical protein
MTQVSPFDWPPWALMWTMAVAIYTGCKWLTWQRVAVPDWDFAYGTLTNHAESGEKYAATRHGARSSATDRYQKGVDRSPRILYRQSQWR